jgi:hypothetical protein
MYNADNNLRMFLRPSETDLELAMARIRAVLGDFGDNGAIDNQFPGTSEQPAASGAFLLWAPGPDSLYGPTDTVKAPSGIDPWQTNRRLVEKCDDVTNFR